MISTFAVLAEPNRRTILSLLASSERSVGEIENRLRMPQTSVSKHLRVLRDAGFVEARVDAQRRVYRLRPEPLQEVDGWLEPFRRLWTAHVDALERHLDRMDAIAPDPGPGPEGERREAADPPRRKYRRVRGSAIPEARAERARESRRGGAGRASGDKRTRRKDDDDERT